MFDGRLEPFLFQPKPVRSLGERENRRGLAGELVLNETSRSRRLRQNLRGGGSTSSGEKGRGGD